MKTTIDTPGVKFKAKEADFRSKLPPRSIVGIRLDGKAFHTYTKQFVYPYDLNFMNTMDSVTLHLLNKVVQGGMLAYTQSDEISIFFTDRIGTKENRSLFNAGKIEKILSISASAATGAFMKALPEGEGIPMFDARLFVVEDMDEVQEYLDWRRLDARKNSISMAASALYSHKQLNGVSTRDRAGLLKGTKFEVLPEGFFQGRLFHKSDVMETTTFFNKKNGKDQVIKAMRSRWFKTPATRERTAQEVDVFRTMIG